MRVVIGPVSGASARSWLEYARGVIDDLDVVAPAQCDSIPETADIFTTYVAEWEAVAGIADTFLWEADREPEHVQYHLHALHRVAQALVARSDVTGDRTMPDEGRDFYSAVLRGMFDALDAEGPEYRSFVHDLATFWPGQGVVVG